MTEPQVLTPWHIVESMEKTLKEFVDQESVDKDLIEDFMSYTASSLAQLCGVVDQLRGKTVFK